MFKKKKNWGVENTGMNPARAKEGCRMKHEDNDRNVL
jgi:hypothetical protein